MFGALALMACGEGMPKLEGRDASMPGAQDASTSWAAADVEAFLARACLRCHNQDEQPSPPLGLSFDAELWYEQIVDVPSVQVPRLKRIDIGFPDQSYLLLKLSGPGVEARLTEIPECVIGGGPCGRSMGSGPIYPTSADVVGLTGWIEAGAPR